MQQLIVTSATYRQSSEVTPELLERDPENALLARGPRFRLDAEVVRDSALSVSGLLVEQIGGRSVQAVPAAGIWEAVGFRRQQHGELQARRGAGLYRRSLYTFWKRTAPPPSLMTFDAPSRETCTVRRPRTNTPLQALVLMNDEQYVEAARHLAERMMTEGGHVAAGAGRVRLPAGHGAEAGRGRVGVLRQSLSGATGRLSSRQGSRREAAGRRRVEAQRVARRERTGRLHDGGQFDFESG